MNMTRDDAVHYRQYRQPRRLAVLTVLLTALLLTATGCGSGGSDSGKKQDDGQKPETVNVNVAVLTDINSVMAAAVVHRMKKTGLFEKTAQEMGQDIKVNWKQFPFAPPLLADAASGGVQIGTIATFPIMNALSKQQQVTPLHVSFGKWEFMIVVRKDGDIRNFEDLKGKTVGLALGTTLQEFFEVFTQVELGGSPKELGIKLVGQPIPTATMPRGVDAIVTFIPAWLPLQDKSELQVLVNSFGETGPAYDGPLGKGAGHQVPSVKESPFAPEGYVALRNVFCTFGGFSKSNPEVVKAWLVAYQKTLRELSAQSPMEITELFPEKLWQTMPREKYAELSIGRDLLYENRDWIWPTQGELDIMLKENELMVRMGLLPKPLDREQITGSFQENLPLLKAAYDEVKYPAADEFADRAPGDIRGAPLWDVIKE